MKLYTTLNLIRSQCPRQSYKRVLNAVGPDFGKDEKIDLLSILDSNGVGDTLWAIRTVERPSGGVHVALDFTKWCASRARAHAIAARAENEDAAGYVDPDSYAARAISAADYVAGFAAASADCAAAYAVKALADNVVRVSDYASGAEDAACNAAYCAGISSPWSDGTSTLEDERVAQKAKLVELLS